ncbi:MAG: hydantoinase B/oxoprolinase family protein [Pseudomonadota bacterium]|jgi:N-methylhydantoinase B|uniref:N-methylhydantoinase B n=1 Tax=hydrothermal vent metagenome TaxID=652676 RepID=A0A170PPA9_9ZZZZ
MNPARSWTIHAGFGALVDEMEALFARLARGPLVAGGRHFAIALLDGDLRLLAQNRSDPHMLFVPREAGRHLLDYFAYDIAPGDIFLLGDPHRAGTGWHEVSIALPVIEQDILRYLCVLHFAVSDLGGELPGQWQPFATDIWQERLIVTPLRLSRAGRDVADVARLLGVNSRAAHTLSHDLAAARSVATEMECRLRGLLVEHGWPLLNTAAAFGRDYASRRISEQLRAILPLAGGKGSATFPGGDRVSVTLRWNGERIAASAHSATRQGDDSHHATPSLSKASMLLPLLAGTLDDVPLNDAVLEAIDIHLPAGSRLLPDADRACSLGRFAVAGPLAAAVTDALRDAGAPARLTPDPGSGMAPGLVVHAPVGSASAIDPLSLSLGFAPGAGGLPLGWSAAPLVSAEEVEQRHRLVLRYRKWAADAMHVAVQNSGVDAELTLVALQPCASLQREGDARQGMMAAEAYPAGAVLSLTFQG